MRPLRNLESLRIEAAMSAAPGQAAEATMSAQAAELETSEATMSAQAAALETPAQGEGPEAWLGGVDLRLGLVG